MVPDGASIGPHPLSTGAPAALERFACRAATQPGLSHSVQPVRVAARPAAENLKLRYSASGFSRSGYRLLIQLTIALASPWALVRTPALTRLLVRPMQLPSARTLPLS